jgi:hypothetical protein
MSRRPCGAGAQRQQRRRPAAPAMNCELRSATVRRISSGVAVGGTGRQDSRSAWGKACARVGAIHGVGGGSGGGGRRRRAACAVGCHPEVVRTARRRRGGSSVAGGQEAGAGDGAMASRGVVTVVLCARVS